MIVMAITIGREIKRIDRKTFHEIDFHITGLAYFLHNTIGRLLDESIYKNVLARWCRDAGFRNVLTEEIIVVSYKDFSKHYFIDLLVEDSIIYELKAVHSLHREHDKQALSYLFLTGLAHAKLINFRPVSVEKRFVSTTICPEDRYNFFPETKYWLDWDEDSLNLKQLILELLHDWGAYLEINLFYEAICHFRAGEEHVLKEIPIMLDKTSVLGRQKIHLLNEKNAFKITAITKGIDNYEKHLRRFIQLTKLTSIQWINFNKNVIVFKTIQNR